MHSRKEKKNKKDLETKRPRRRALIHLIMALSAAALLGMGFWLLWNLAGVPIFGIPPLTYWQALGAILLSGVLLRFTMFRGSRHHRYRSKHFTMVGCPRTRYHAENGSGDI